MLNEAIAEGLYPGIEGPRRNAARAAEVSPDALNAMLERKFPVRLSTTKNPVHRKKVIQGATETLVRVCDHFGFDLETALGIFKLPRDKIVIDGVRIRRDKKISHLDLPDLSMLKSHVENFGPVRLIEVPHLVEKFRKKDS